MIRALRSHGSPGGHVESLYRDHAAEVYRYALAMLGSPADAEDATQATFLNAFRAIERGDAPRQPGAWLRTIVHNLCLQQFRQSARRPHQVALDDEADELFADEQTPAIEDVIRALKLVPFNQRAALVMREFEGRPLPEIAEALEVTPAAVETLLFRARRSLREQLEESLTCAEAELAISRQLDGVLPRSDRGALRAHLRQCEACARHARSLRGQRKSMQSLAVLPVPAALAWWHGTGAGAGGPVGTAAAGAAAPAGVSLIVKVAAVVLTTGAVGGIGYVGVKQGIIATPSAAPTLTTVHSARRATDHPSAAIVAALKQSFRGHTGIAVGDLMPYGISRRPLPAPLSPTLPSDDPTQLAPPDGLGDPLQGLTGRGPAPSDPQPDSQGAGSGGTAAAGSTENGTPNGNPGAGSGNPAANPGGQGNSGATPGTGAQGNPGGQGNQGTGGEGNQGTGGEGNQGTGGEGNQGGENPRPGNGHGNPDGTAGGSDQGNSGVNANANGQSNPGQHGQNAGGPPSVHGRTEPPGKSATNGHAAAGDPGNGSNPANSGGAVNPDSGNAAAGPGNGSATAASNGNGNAAGSPGHGANAAAGAAAAGNGHVGNSTNATSAGGNGGPPGPAGATPTSAGTNGSPAGSANPGGPNPDQGAPQPNATNPAPTGPNQNATPGAAHSTPGAPTPTMGANANQTPPSTPGKKTATPSSN